MVRESLSRKFKPAGFEQPEGSRQNYVKPRPELQEAFEKWIEESNNDYNFFLKREEGYKRSQELIQHFGEIPYREVSALLVDFEPKNYAEENVGLFLSACYNQSSKQIIVFDLEAPKIDNIGYKLGKNKILVNNGDVGYRLGDNSSGLTILTGKAINWISSWTLGTFIDLRDPEKYGIVSRQLWFLTPKRRERTNGLRKYMDDLKDAVKEIKDEGSEKGFVERYGIGGEKIKPEIEELFRKGWFEF